MAKKKTSKKVKKIENIQIEDKKDNLLLERNNIQYLQPKMKFNPGTLNYEPSLMNKRTNNKMQKIEKLKIWIFIALIITLLLIIGLWVYSRSF